MKKLLKRTVAFLLTFAITAGILPAAVLADDNVYTLSNDYIKVEVSGKNGGFHIDTVEGDKLEKDDNNKMLLHNSEDYDTSFTSFRITVDGKEKDYIFGRGYGFLGLSGTDVQTVKEGENRIVSTWTVEGVEITQNIELANNSSSENGMVIISYTSKNNGDNAVDDIKARIMLDTALGYQDYAYYKIPSNGTYITVENEQVIDGGSIGNMMFGYDDEFLPKITAYTVNATVDDQECVPEKIAFGHWNNLAATVYDFTPNENLTFTNEYNVQYLTADSAYALYFGMGSLEKGESSSIATNYGVYSNAGVSQESKLAINISGANPMKLNSDKTAYVSANSNDAEGELTIMASIKNFESDTATDLSNVKIAVYADSMMMPIDENGSTTDINGDTYSSENLYSIDFTSIAVNQTQNVNFRFKAELNKTATYRKIQLVAYQMSDDSELLMQENIIGSQSVYILCPGTDDGIPDVVLTGCTEYMYYSGKQRINVTGLNFSMLTDQSAYNLKLKQIIDDNTYSEVITIDSSNSVLNEVDNTMDITVPEFTDENTGETKKWPTGTYQLVIDYIDDSKTDVVSTAAKIIVTDDAKYANFGYGIITVEQTGFPNPDIAACEYEVRTYTTEEQYKEYIKQNPDAEILVELKGDFSEKRYDEETGYPYYEADVIEANGEAQNPVTLNGTMELRSGYMKVIIENEGTSDQSILVDVDGNMRMAGTGTLIYNGTAALTEIKNGLDYDLRKYTEDGIRCETLETSDPRYQNMSNKQTITYVFSKEFDTFVSIASVVNADLTFGELGEMVDRNNNKLTKLVSFGAKIDLGVIIPKGSSEFKKDFKTAWKSYTSTVWENTKSKFTGATTSRSVREAWSSFKSSDYATEYAARKSKGLIQACAEVEDVLFGEGKFIGVNFSVDIGVPPLTTAMPAMTGTLTVNTMGDWRFGIEGYAEFVGLTVEAKLEVIYSQELGAPIPNEIYFYIEFPPPGFNVDGFAVVWLRGGGGGISNLYELVYTPNTLPSTSIILSIGASMIQVITLKINLEMSLTGMSLVAERGTLSETGILVLRNSGIRFQWLPSFKFTGNVNVDFLGILNGSGYIVIDPANSSYEFFAMVSLMIPKAIPLIGGKTLGSVGVGVNEEKIWGRVTIIGISFGILYYWGGDFSFVSGSGKGLDPTYPELLSAGDFELLSEDDVPVAYDEDTGRTLYAHVVPNFTLVKTASVSDSILPLDGGTPAAEVTLKSNADKTNHLLNLGAYTGDNGALNITFPAASENEAYELAKKITITKANTLTSYPITVLDKDESNADTANAFVVYSEPENEGEKGEARVVVSFTDENSFNTDWNISTPAASDLDIYNVSSMPEFALNKGEINNDKVNLEWTVKNGTNSNLDKISVYASTDDNPENMGTLIGIISDEDVLTAGKASLDIPADMSSGEYYIRVVATMDETLIDTVVTDDTYTFTNSNQPKAAKSVSVSNAGDYRLRVTSEDPDDDCYGYQVNLYEVTEKDGQTVYTELENVSGAIFSADDELVVGGRYEYLPEQTEDAEEDSEPVYIGLEPGKTYAAGICRINYLYDNDGNQIAIVTSEEKFSDGITLTEPNPPEVSAAIAAADGTAAVNLTSGTVGGNEIEVPTVSSGDVSIQLTSNMPVSGKWYLDNLSYDAAFDEEENGGAENTYGEFTSDENNEFTINLTDLETQDHTLHIEGTNEAGDGFTKTVNFSVDTQAPLLALNSPIMGAVAKNDVITVSGRTDIDAKLKVEVNGELIGEKTADQWDTSSADGSFEFTVPADGSILKNKVTFTATDNIGNVTKKTISTVNERITDLAGVRLYIDDEDVTNTQVDTSAAIDGNLELMGVTSDGEVFAINDESMIEWSARTVDGRIEVLEEGEAISLFSIGDTANTDRVISVDKNTLGMVSGMLRLTNDSGMSAAASFGISDTHQITYDNPENATVKVSPSNAKAGDTVTVTVTPKDGYVFKGWKSNSSSVEFADRNALTTTFVMPDDDVHISAVIESLNPTEPTVQPTAEPTVQPTTEPTVQPTTEPTVQPTAQPTTEPTATPKRSSGGSSINLATPTPSPTVSPEPTGTPSAAQEPENHIAYISGYDDGTFRPDNSISRAETATIIARLTDGFDEDAAYTSSFHDVISGAWYEKYIAFEEDKGVISGYPDGSFNPDGNITRAEFAAVIAKYAGLSSDDETDVPFADIDGHWASEQIDLCYANGYISGYEDNTFKPDNYITRAEAVAIINRVLERVPDKEAVNNSISSIYAEAFTDALQGHWGYYEIMEASITHNAEDFH